MHDKMRELGTDPYSVLSDNSVRIIYDNNDVLYAIRDYLNDLEEICTAVNSGAVDEDYAYALESATIVLAFGVFQPLIERQRERFNIDTVWIELQKRALRWKKRQIKEISTRKQQLIELAAAVDREKGIHEKY